MNTDKRPLSLWEMVRVRAFDVSICSILALAILCIIPTVLSAADSKKPDNARDMFRALGVEDRYFDRLIDDRSLNSDERETVLRILYRLRTFPLVDIDRWAQNAGELAEASRQPKKYRGEIYNLRGRVIEVEPIKPPSDPATRYELAQYYRCRLQLDEPDMLADVYTENVPKQWSGGAKPDASAGAFGVFLKLAEKTDGDEPLLVFAAVRLAWYPDNLLGRLGMDFGLLDSVKDQKLITADESEAFYQMLAAVGRAKPGELLRQAENKLTDVPADERWTDQQGQERYSVAPLFNEAVAQRGRLVELLGTARRIEKILVSDADITARFGIDHYYMVSLFTDDSQGNPLTFCILDLPEGMPFGNLPRYGETVRVAGFFFKTWNYAVPIMADPSLSPGDPKTHRQLSPLLIGRSLVWHPAPKPADRSLPDMVIVGLIVLIMVIVWFAAWQNHRHEKKKEGLGIGD
jgi:hypothetical protein